MPRRDQIFVSYSHADAKHLKRLLVHFKPFENKSSLEIWSDEKIRPGQQWRQEIENALRKTAVAILLVSADFLASDFIKNEELPHLLDAAKSEGVNILCFIIGPCSFDSTSLSRYQAANDPAKPLIAFNKQAKRDELWKKLVQDAIGALDGFKAKESASDAIEQTTSPYRDLIKWNKVATLFWLGNDLMWIEDMTYRMANPDRVLQGVENALVYVKNFGFTDNSLPMQELTNAKLTLHQLNGISPETHNEFLQGHYRGIRKHIETVKFYIARLAEVQEPDFKKLRAL